MSATVAAQQKSIAAISPNHLVSYEWETRKAELEAALEARGLPPLPGHGWRYKAPKELRQALW